MISYRGGGVSNWITSAYPTETVRRTLVNLNGILLGLDLFDVVVDDHLCKDSEAVASDVVITKMDALNCAAERC